MTPRPWREVLNLTHEPAPTARMIEGATIALKVARHPQSCTGSAERRAELLAAREAGVEEIAS